MTTRFEFVPSFQAPFQFQPTLDGNIYTAIVTWNLFGERYYVNLYQLTGDLVFSLPLIGSTVGINLDSLVWDIGTVTATAVAPLVQAIGETVDVTISGALPDGYNGAVQALITGSNTFSYPLQANPGPATQFGIVNYDIDLAAGYFDSTLVYRAAAAQFEVTP